MDKFVRGLAIALLPAMLAGLGSPVQAGITRIEITSRALAYGGASFGSVGQYERLTGIAYGEVDPNDPLNEVITDIKLAPRNARGMVEYNMDFWISKPVIMANANGTLLHDVPNRGRVRSLELNVGGGGDNTAGDGFLQRQGFVLADNGWQGDVSTGLQIRLPIARNRNGSEITGRVRAEYILDAPASTVDVTTPPAYEAVSTSNAGATLTRRVHQDDVQGSHSEQSVGVRRLRRAGVPGCTEHDEGLPQRQFRYQSHLRAALRREESDGARTWVRRDP